MSIQDGSGLRALLLDDDDFALEFLEVFLSTRFPELEIETRKNPDPTGDFDLYFLDDDFEGVCLAGKLARRIRAQRPDAIIIAFSACLDGQTLKELLAAGCNGVCDKRVAKDLPAMLAALERCLEELEEQRKKPPTDLTGRYLLKIFRELFREWNRRLDLQRGAEPPESDGVSKKAG
jgi:DNA-binding NarL/FixJ family response regulator